MGIVERKNLLRAEALHKEYLMGKDLRLHVLKGLDMEVKEGEITVIIGPSGSGKSTLLHILGGLDRPTSGMVAVDGNELSLLGEEELAAFRNRTLGFIFQFHHLLPEFTALENVMMPLLINGMKTSKAREKAREMLEEVGLGDRLYHRSNQLSGGQNQRVAVARALVNNPSIVIGDEPTGNLDSKSSDNIYELLRKLNREHNQTFILVTHDERMAAKTDRIIRLVDGKVVEDSRKV